MPIRLNLLAEAQAAEELRRRDPIKRVIFGGVLVVALMLAWWSWLQLRVMVANSNLSQIEAQIQSHTNAYQVVLVSEKKIAETKANLAALQKLTGNRFLQGNLLNALQYATVPGVQLVRLRVDQTYQVNQGIGHSDQRHQLRKKLSCHWMRRTSAATRVIKSTDLKMPSVDESYFEAALGKTNVVRLTNLSAPQVDANGKPSVLFTLQCAYPDQTR